MTSRQESKLSMFLATKDLVTSSANATILAALQGMSGYVTNFTGNVSAIHAIRLTQELNTGGFSANKLELKNDLIFKTLDIAAKLKAFAVNTGNTILINEIGYTKSKMERAADTVLRDITQVIYNKANTNAAAIVAYGVSAANLTALQNAITAYLASIPKPRAGIVTTKQATQQLADLFKATDAVLEKMDVVVESVKNSNPTFWKNYVDSRMIIDAGSSKLSLRGKVTDKSNSEVLSGVVIIIKGTDVKVKTTDKGNFTVKSLAAGSYSLVCSKNGFKDCTVVADITDNERTDVVVEMERN